MDNNTDLLHEARRLRLLDAALELQHFTSAATNIVPIPGGDRVVAIGTPAQVRALLADDAIVLSAWEFGAVADGATDDTAALQRAADWCATSAADAKDGEDAAPLKNRIEKLRAALQQISETRFGHDGDSGVIGIANEALYADEQIKAVESSASDALAQRARPPRGNCIKCLGTGWRRPDAKCPSCDGTGHLNVAISTSGSKDATRYRWLVKQIPCNIADALQCGIPCIAETIDAAIAASQKGGA